MANVIQWVEEEYREGNLLEHVQKILKSKTPGQIILNVDGSGIVSSVAWRKKVTLSDQKSLDSRGATEITVAR